MVTSNFSYSLIGENWMIPMKIERNLKVLIFITSNFLRNKSTHSINNYIDQLKPVIET